jgi:hypothetical protein
MKNSGQTVPPTLRLNALPTPLNPDIAPSFAKTMTVDELNSFPCRRCLQDGKIGHVMRLVSYDPWLGDSPYRQPGPIFVHASPQCAPYTPDGLVPDQLDRRLMSLRCFDADHFMVSSDVVQGDKLIETAVGMMQNERAEYIHVHNARPGCFAVRIDRA